MDLVASIIKELRQNKKLKNYKYNIRKIIGLPNLKFLSLTSNEKKFLNKDFKRFQSNSLDALKRLVSFYDKFSIVYGKSKHGLAYITGGLSNLNEETAFDNSFLQCYGRVGKQDKIPKGYFISSIVGSTPQIRLKYFNFISVISFRKKLFEEINSAISDLKTLISFICTNHRTYG